MSMKFDRYSEIVIENLDFVEFTSKDVDRSAIATDSIISKNVEMVVESLEFTEFISKDVDRTETATDPMVSNFENQIFPVQQQEFNGEIDELEPVIEIELDNNFEYSKKPQVEEDARSEATTTLTDAFSMNKKSKKLK